MHYLNSLVPSSPPSLARLVVERDALLALLMWGTSMRGKNCGAVTLPDLFQSDGQRLTADTSSLTQGGFLLLLLLEGLKEH